MINRLITHTADAAVDLPLNSHQKFAGKWIRTVGGIEGISFLLLLFVAMPIKYLGGNPTLVHWLGPIHGGLFLLYLASAVAVAHVLKWRWFHLMLALAASVLPFGPFVFEAWMRRTHQAQACFAALAAMPSAAMPL
jgi:integral membrane protein